MQTRVLCYAIVSLLSFNVYGQYIYESNQALYDLHDNANNFNGELAYEVSDDGISPAIDLSFNFTFYGSTFSKARMATNGCLHFGSSGSYCSDYTPDPINGQHTYTIYPFWTDLIRDNNSRMKSYGDSEKMIFGWYRLREFNRSNTDNSFEVILWNNNSFDIRYRELEIINHDVLIGEVGANKNNSYTYYYHDECNTGTTNSSTCVNTNWNNTTINTTLENGGSLFGEGSGNGVDCSNPLNDSSCSGYADALLTQQCNITQLYSESCPNYWDAYDDQQCADDPQYAPFCAGYRQEQSVAFFNDSNVDYGFVDEQEQFATGIFGNENHENDFQDQFFIVEVFEEEMFIPFDDFSENPIEFFDGPITEELVIFFDPEPLPFIDEFGPRHDEPFHNQDELLLDEFVFQETFLVEDYTEPNTFISFNTVEDLEEWFEEETNEHHEERHEERLADLDEPEEEFIEEIFEEEAVEEVFEEIEEMQEMMEEERIAEREEEIRDEIVEEVAEEFEVVERENPSGKNRLMTVALNVVKAGVQTAANSYSQASGASQNNTTANSSTSNINTGSVASSGGGISTSNSPSVSDQFASSTQQTNQVLSMSDNLSGSGGANISITPLPTFDNQASVAIADVQVSNVQGQIDTASSGVMTSSEADQIAEKIIAANIEAQQEEIEQEQQETGEYGDETTLVALIGYVPGFNTYQQTSMVDNTDWYISANIYTSAKLDDNTEAFFGLVNDNLKGLGQMIEDQPNIWR
tara:strand:+ start:1919 stop:4168 length:2250 start_codon:yes stop_codon:yes gene_type:complete